MKVKKAIEANAPPEKIWPFFVEPAKVLQWCVTFKRLSTPLINVVAWERLFTSRKMPGLA